MNGTPPASKCSVNCRPVLLLAGDFDWQHVDVAALAQSRNWEVRVTGSMQAESPQSDVRAVFCRVDDNDVQPIEEARRLYPRARIVACSRFRCPVDWDRMEASGAFHHLRLPFDEYEVSLSLGFLAAALAKENLPVATLPQILRPHPPARETLRAAVRHRERFRWRLRPA